MQWVVLNWNIPSIEYYKRQGAFDLTEKEKWHIFRMNENEMKDFVS
jgi:diamine N-acetyltransferase